MKNICGGYGIMNFNKYTFSGDKILSISEFNAGDTGPFKSKEEAVGKTQENLKKLEYLQDKLYAESKEAILIIFQAMDTAGKDGAIKHVMSGVNPQGIDVHSFKQPSAEELSHDYLWRVTKAMPQKGKITIFNRSYYEDVLVARVHKLYKNQNLPERCVTGDIIERRYAQINNLEKYLWENGIRIVKFFLNISKEEQKKRIIKRIDDKTKNWKFSESDIKERKCWDEYQRAYEDAINNTSTKHAPWHVIPSDKKWFSRFLISEVIADALEHINPQYPKLPEEKEEILKECRKQPMSE